MRKKYVFNVINQCRKCGIVTERYVQNPNRKLDKFVYTCTLLKKKVDPDKIDKNCKLFEYIEREIDGAIAS